MARRRRRRDKPTFDNYTEWMLREQGVDLIGGVERRHYDVASSQMCDQFEQSPVWQGIGAAYRDWDDEYYARTGHHLYPHGELPGLLVKPFDSVVDKSYRWNIANNANWPEPPDDGWVLPENWLARFNDVVRTCFVVNFLDGVAYLSGRLQGLCEQERVHGESRFVASDDGYYAHHLSVNSSFSVVTKSWRPETLKSQVELQITTQIKAAITLLLHHVYDRRRTEGGLPEGWQWDYESKEFGTNYLGHVLHYMEGMIMNVREQEA